MDNTRSLKRDDVRELVKQKYAEAASTVLLAEGTASCCGESTGCCATDQITSGLYTGAEASSIPPDAIRASLGCGNPTALAELRPGETVLDLGSGGGIDVLLSARRVGPTGFAYGLDMTDEMLTLAERNRLEAGVENVTFLRGHIEEIPLPDRSVDVVISNCVINLSGDKGQVLREAFRVLAPGGRLAVSDVVVEGELPEQLRQSAELYVGCVAGALSIDVYHRLLEDAGFVDVSLEPTRRYTFSDIEVTDSADGLGSLSAEDRVAIDGKVMSAFIRATKPR